MEDHAIVQPGRWHLSVASPCALRAELDVGELAELMRDPALRQRLEQFLVGCARVVRGLSALELCDARQVVAVLHLTESGPAWDWREARADDDVTPSTR